MPFAIKNIPRPKKAKQLPVVLDKNEVLRIFNAVENLKHRTIPMLTYASGLRSELLIPCIMAVYHNFQREFLFATRDEGLVKQLSTPNFNVY